VNLGAICHGKRSRVRVSRCHVEGTFKAVEDTGSTWKFFLVSLRGRSWLERLPVTQEVAGSSPVAPANLQGSGPGTWVTQRT
jgi:hypothetical protein